MHLPVPLSRGCFALGFRPRRPGNGLPFCLVGYVVYGEGSGASGFTYWREEGGGFVSTTTICGEGVGVEQHGVRFQDERRMPDGT